MKFWMLCASLLLAGIGLLAAQPATVWRDPSPHQTRFVTVDSSVRLEVLDWGGSGWPAKDPQARALTGGEGTLADGTKMLFGISKPGSGEDT